MILNQNVEGTLGSARNPVLSVFHTDFKTTEKQTTKKKIGKHFKSNDPKIVLVQKTDANQTQYIQTSSHKWSV